MNESHVLFCESHFFRFVVNGDDVRIIERAGLIVVRERTLPREQARSEYSRLMDEGFRSW